MRKNRLIIIVMPTLSTWEETKTSFEKRLKPSLSNIKRELSLNWDEVYTVLHDT